MPNVANFAPASHADSIGDLIAIKPTSITVVRGGVQQAAQTVRLETLASQMRVQGSGGVTHEIDAHLLGYKNHSSIADTDLKAGDRFVADGVAYEVEIILPAHVDCLQAYLVVRS